MLAEFASWWLARMREVVAPLVDRLMPREIIVLRPADPAAISIEVLRRRRSQLVSLGRFKPEREAATIVKLVGAGPAPVLRLDTPALARIVRLPLAAETGLATLLRYEMDRLTPFAAEDVFWSWRIVGRQRAADALDVELQLMPRAPLADLLARLTAAGVVPGVIEVALPNETWCQLPVEAPDQAMASNRHRLRIAAVALTAALAAACVVTPLLRQSLALQQVEAEIADMRAPVSEAQSLQKRIAGSVSGDDVLAAAQRQSTTSLQVLAALTDAVPDNTYVTRLTVQQLRLTMEGQSEAASQLITALADRPHLQNPAFTAPVIRTDSGREIFALRAEFKP